MIDSSEQCTLCTGITTVTFTVLCAVGDALVINSDCVCANITQNYEETRTSGNAADSCSEMFHLNFGWDTEYSQFPRPFPQHLQADAGIVS
jgi:hypothetical protein